MLFPALKIDVWTIIAMVCAAMLLIQLFYFLYFFIRLTLHKEPVGSGFDSQPVSVIIAARNEEKNLRKNLPKILSQDYFEYQVVVINDRSWDGTEDLLRELKKKHKNLYVITIHDNDLSNHGKKLALTLGVKGAKYEMLLFTDADCEPSSQNWISEMMAGYDGNDIVLGYSPYRKNKGILNWFIRFDTVQVAMQYLSFALAGVPYMGVGRNLSYKKSLFEEVRGYKSHYHIPSGDDDLFVNQVARKSNVKIKVSKDAFVASTPKETWRDWWYQKKRHFSTSGFYKWHHKVLLAVYPVSLMLLVVGTLVSAFGPWKWVVLGMYGFRLLCQMAIFRKIYKKLEEGDLLILTPILELVFIIINPLIHLSNIFVKPKRWA